MSTQPESIKNIRTTFIDYFQSKNHLIKPSDSLIPHGDPTLLFTTAGMVPFKDYFAGIATPPAKRIASVQKCFRTTDLEEVGKTKRHLSFFEMLGNFSFGDYFKKEAIEFAWEYTTNFLPFDKEQIWISIYLDDDDAFDLWNKHIGVPEKRIVRLDKKDNFWGPAGSTGACGPCSELYLDRGPEYSCESDPCQPGDEGERFMEFWNLVFNQFDLTAAGKYEPLAQTGIDTGAGLERIAALAQNVDSVYDTDELASLVQAISGVYDTPYQDKNIVPIRVLTDHIRALSFAIADGILPSNESRGYVLRRMLRRALLFGRQIGQKEPLLYKLIPKVIEIYGYFYNNLEQNQDLIKDYVHSEEKRFLQTMDDGYEKITALVERAKEGAYPDKTVPGKEIFTLYDTFGFPPEMSSEMLENEGISVEMESYYEEMEKQRSRGKAAWKSSGDQKLSVDIETQFVGYDKLHTDTTIAELILGSAPQDKIELSEVGEGGSFIVVTPHTPCYPESGGQVGDTGIITGEGFTCNVDNTRKQGELIFHECSQLSGSLTKGEAAHIRVEKNRRSLLAQNHSSTHLLNGSLRKIFGEHIKQSGSLVHPDYLRFDFTHPKALSENEVEEIENQVNKAIESASAVTTQVLSLEEAQKKGAVMTFGEKYGDTVRVVQMGDYSMEFCGGTHVEKIDDIGFFIITKESSPGAGNRRIEALSGEKAKERLETTYQELMARLLKIEKEAPQNLLSKAKELADKAKALRSEYEGQSNLIDSWHKLKKSDEELKELEVEVKREQKKSAQKMDIDSSYIDNILESKKQQGNLAIAASVVNENIPYMKSLADEVRSREGDLILILAGVSQGKWNYLLATTKSYAQTQSLDLSQALKNIIPNVEGISGGGGGKKEMAQGSGTFEGDPDTIVNSLIQTGFSVFASL